MKKRLLLIDENAQSLTELKDFLSKSGYEVTVSTQPRPALRLMAEAEWDVVLLGQSIKELDSITFSEQIQERHSVPVVIADTAKPLDSKQLLQQIKSVIRELKTVDKIQKLVSGNLEIHVTERKVFLAGKPVALSESEFEVLTLLAKHPQRTFDREQIAQALGKDGFGALDRSIDILISRLRQKLGDSAKHPVFIRTVRGGGYKFAGR